MDNIPLNIMAAIRRDQPVEIDGLTFYPVLMDEFEEFAAARESLELMQQTLPIKYLTMPFLSAVYALDYDLTKNGQPSTGMFARTLQLLALSMRILKGLPMQRRISSFQLNVDGDDPSILKKITFLKDGEERLSITPMQFARYRPILAAQNGVELPDESANLDILESERILNEKNAKPLDTNIDDLIASIAVVTKCDESEIFNWSIRKFFLRRKAIDRILSFVVCGIGELNGRVKWKGGNPAPSWCFDKAKGLSSALISAGEFIGAQGSAVTQRNM